MPDEGRVLPPRQPCPESHGDRCGSCFRCDAHHIAHPTSGRVFPPHVHRWLHLTFPADDGSVTEFCLHCGEKRDLIAPARVQS